MLTSDQVIQLGEYCATLDLFNPRLNLTALTDPATQVAELVLDSLLLTRLSADIRAARVVDIGSGGGVPGIPLAIACPGWTVELLERKSSLALYLEEAVRRARVLNATVLNIALEHYPFRTIRERLLFTSKAVFHVEQLCEQLTRFAPKSAQAAWWGTPGLDADSLSGDWSIEATTTATLPVTGRPTAVYLLSRE